MRTLSFSSVTLVAVCFAALSVAAAAITTTPRRPEGYFVLLPAKGAIELDALLANPNIAGCEIRDRWANVNPAPGEFDFSRLAAAAEKIKASGKKYSLVILTGTSAPAWLYDHDVKSLQVTVGKFDPSNVMPVPWDAVMLRYHDEMVGALGKKFADDQSLVKVNISGPTRGSLEMHLPREVPFDPTKVVEAWKTATTSYAKAFPDVACSLNLANPYRAVDGCAAAAAENAIAILGPRACFQHDAYNSKPAQEAYNINRILLALQARGQWTGLEQVTASTNADRYGPNGFAWSVRRAQVYGVKFFDLYRPDDGLIKEPFKPLPAQAPSKTKATPRR